MPYVLSVVIPTYNCCDLIKRHIDSVNSWSDLAYEIIVVDSYSNDGTLDAIRKSLKHQNLRIVERERGLYESWNHAISMTSGDWVYISTAGDTISRDHLVHLMTIGDSHKADVVISEPAFFSEDFKPIKKIKWPPRKIIEVLKLKEPKVISPEQATSFSIILSPCCILGSSASNIYRGNIIRQRPFPTNFSGAGDTAWGIRNSSALRFCYTPKTGSKFIVHKKPSEDSYGKRMEILDLINNETTEAARSLGGAILDEIGRCNNFSFITSMFWNKRRSERGLVLKNPWKLLSWLKSSIAYAYFRGRLGLSRKKMERILCKKS